MLKVIQSPSKYIQGPGALSHIGQYTKILADHVFVIADNFVMSLIGDAVSKSLEAHAVTSHFEIFNGECSRGEIKRLSDISASHQCQAVIGIGGGKTLDTAKAIAHACRLPVIISPTIASTDAPTSALSVLYTELGEFDGYLLYPQNPNIVLMDTRIIAKAPVRLLVAGMGDALATYFEARANSAAHKPTMAGGATSNTGLALAKLCYDTLLAEGYKAKLAVEAGVSTPAVENIIEANTYLSGIGFESAGLAAAHAIHNGFTVLEECHHLYHGEKVAFGTLAQLMLENSPNEELETVLDFCVQVGLPVTLEQLGLRDSEKLHQKIMEVAKASCAEGETIHNMPFKVTPEQVYAAIMAADRMGMDWLY
ncbi:glycerol dehydrogenase, NAD [Xenorhabdus bovienii str. Jollieti]|uniref:Glycerol dehydrogenase n=1 Tax=Xenorhabdus bovienii (strain SS-2004) TaxID=406818 RepID=D3UZA6_XENBS|nr:glycerol dehydrogenase [Xenorhabdus bovienii]CBJ79688.1 glycerol dehydrogenase, NAD [Xenorhabdus bovienii SS-2004]CDH28226.1 glycerol dehydrogenase, NAD [Xenorhabdus bovienii str. Jollieti]